jgi:hypothetical protein
MTLESATKTIIESTCKWVNTFKHNSAYVAINFPSLFIHYSKNILSRTDEFSKYGKLYFLKQRNMAYDFCEGEVKYIQIYNPDDNIHIERFKNQIKYEILQYYKKNPVEANVESEKELLNLQELNQFKF